MAGVRRADDGFTLIEIMVVVTIIGIMTGLIAINVITQDPQKDLNKEAQRFLAVMQMAQEEALFSQQEIGVIVTEEGYRFARWGVPAQPEESAMTTTDPALSGRDEDPDAATNAALSLALNNTTENRPQPRWMLITSDNALRDHKLDEAYEILLEVDHEAIDITGGVDQQEREDAKQAEKILQEEEEELKPAIFVMSSGELSPFELEMYWREDDDIHAKVSGDATGRLWIGDEFDASDAQD
ncbi:MAG: prepilin-type N-terminal cleavage/methylation domain-containing protein [Pseudomonadota bacterium]|nr:type II secretion system protein GspH [Pseudomonadales bacterium]MDY6921619.1 prepilin-type N-terminal cleavage/methylation domain-containing protein [Pseudomonadota bacterium]